jgi:hypothetical protein
VTLLPGGWSCLGSSLGAAMATNLSQGLYPYVREWPWQYVFLIMIMVEMGPAVIETQPFQAATARSYAAKPSR